MAPSESRGGEVRPGVAVEASLRATRPAHHPLPPLVLQSSAETSTPLLHSAGATYPVIWRNRTVSPARRRRTRAAPAADEARRDRVFARSHGPSTRVRPGITAYWRRHTLSAL